MNHVFAADTKIDKISKEVKQVIQDNIKYLNDEDLGKCMSTIHSKSRGYATNKKQTENLFQRYDLSYKIDKTAFVAKDKDYAYVRVIQTTKKLKGPAFRDNKIEILHILKMEGDQWKIWTSAILKIEYL